MAGQSELAKAYLAVHLDKKALAAELNQLKSAIPQMLKGFAFNLPSKVDTKGITQAANAIRSAVSKMARKSPIVIPVRIDTRAQGKLVSKIRSIARGMARRLAVKIPVKVDSPRASIAIRRLRRDVIKYVAKHPITIPVRLVPIGMQAGMRAMHQNVNKGMGQVKSSMLGSFRSIATIAGGILASIGIYRLTDAVRGLMGAMIGGNAQMEQYQISMKVLLGSADRAAQMIRDIEKMSAETPFEIPGLTKATQYLLKAKFAADDVLPLLRDIGDAAASSPMGMSVAIDRISYALMQVKQAGRVMGQDMRQLTEAGIPAWRYFFCPP